MKATHLAGLLAVPAVLLAGCATQDEMARAQSSDVVDSAYVAQVEQTARSRGVVVRWVNPPQKRLAAASKDL
jgi:hypothetical protein